MDYLWIIGNLDYLRLFAFGLFVHYLKHGFFEIICCRSFETICCRSFETFDYLRLFECGLFVIVGTHCMRTHPILSLQRAEFKLQVEAQQHVGISPRLPALPPPAAA